jgi:antitoxin YefM
VKEVDSEAADLAVLLAEVSGDHTRIGLRSGGVLAGVLLDPAELVAIETTLSLYATVGAREAIVEGLADLAAGRADDWLSLRSDYGRGAADDSATDCGPADAGVADRPAGVPVVSVSHRARWDLELLPPPIAASCFDLLDALATSDGAAGEGLPGPTGLSGRSLVAGLRELQVVLAGFRLVYRFDDPKSTMQVAHIDVPR